MLGRWVTSSASSPSASSAARRAAWRSLRRSGGTQTAHQRLQGQQVALRRRTRSPSPAPDPRSSSAGAPARGRRCSRGAARRREPARPGARRAAARLECVSAAALMSAPSARPLRRLHRVHQRAFVVGLEPVDLGAVPAGRLPDHGLDLAQRRAAVDLRLPLPQQVQVGAVQDAIRIQRFRFCSQAWNWSRSSLLESGARGGRGVVEAPGAPKNSSNETPP